MSRPKKRDKKKAEKVCEYNKKVEFVNIDYTSITNAIVEANQKIKDIEGNKKEEQKEKDLEEWNQILHYKKCPDKSNIIVRVFYEIVNFITLTWSVLFFKKENAKKPIVTFNLLRMLLEAIFGICEYFLYLTMISAIYCLIINETGNGYIIATILSFFFARIFRIIKFEVDNLEDQSLVVTIFSTITSFVAMIIAIVALFM